MFEQADPLTRKVDHERALQVVRNRTLVLVCRSGNRSARATKMLAKAEFDAVNLTGGMTAWKGSGLPMANSRGKKRSVR